MRFNFTREQDEFRQEVRDFLDVEMKAEGIPISISDLVGASSQEFSKKMAERGWIGMTWPKKYGGQERTYVEKMILLEECMRVRAPIGYHFGADRQVGPALIKFGSQWQKEYFLPRIIRADDGVMFCLLFSEPNAGSDLAGAATKAERDGDYYIVNGQKVWTSGGHVADFGWMLAKTNFDKSVNRYSSFSEFIIDMKSDGVTVRPIINMAGEHSFNEVFFEDVKVHKKFLVGTENEGFKQIMAQMDYERAGIERLMQNYRLFEKLKAYLKEIKDNQDRSPFYPLFRDTMAQLEIDFNIGRLLCYYTAWMVDQGKTPTSQAALCKAFCTQYEQRLNDAATKIIGPTSTVKKESDLAALDGDVATCYLWGPSYTLQGGSVEVLKNIVALRGLGLPRK